MTQHRQDHYWVTVSGRVVVGTNDRGSAFQAYKQHAAASAAKRVTLRTDGDHGERLLLDTDWLEDAREHQRRMDTVDFLATYSEW